jgi:(p)ppGpp synthase/HD superfamily hydrolase
MPRTVMNGYSDRINHALAFAAKHHDQQVRRGTRPPYSTQSANIALILTRYGCDEDTVAAGILLDVVEDYSRGTYQQDVLQDRIGEKFGARVLEIARMAAERHADDEGMDLNPDERREDQLARLSRATEEGRLLAAAEALHGAGTLLADLRRTVDAQAVWSRVPGGRERVLDSYRRLLDRLSTSGLRGGIADELRETVEALSEHQG